MGLVESSITNTVNNLPKIDESILREPRNWEDWVSMDIGYGIDSREEVHDMYKTVKKLNLVEWIKNYDSNKRYSEEVNLISNCLENNNHSGASFSGCLWKTSEVFQNGWYPKYSKYVNNSLD